MIVVMAGLPGTGKSAIARRLARALRGVVLDKDAVRAVLFAPRRVEYSTAQDDFVVGLMLQAAGFLLRARPEEPVFIDGRTFSRAMQLAEVERAAEALGSPLVVIECVCSDAVARRRLERAARGRRHLAANRSFALYREIKARFEPIREPKLVVDTDRPLEVCVAECLAYLKGWRARP